MNVTLTLGILHTSDNIRAPTGSATATAKSHVHTQIKVMTK